MTQDLTDFQYPRQYRNKVNRKNNKKSPQKQVVGRGSSDELKGGSSEAEIFVSQLEKGTDSEKLKGYIQRKGVEVLEIEQTSRHFHRFESFRVKINGAYFNRVMNDEFWPKNVACRRFYNRRIMQHRHDDSLSSTEVETMIDDTPPDLRNSYGFNDAHWPRYGEAPNAWY